MRLFSLAVTSMLLGPMASRLAVTRRLLAIIGGEEAKAAIRLARASSQ